MKTYLNRPPKLLIISLITSLIGCTDTTTKIENCFCEQTQILLNSVKQLTTNINYGFYTDFNPLSYSNTQDINSPYYNIPIGYEPDLINAISILTNHQLEFTAVPLGNPFANIWLKSYEFPELDMVGGGITILEDRRYNLDLSSQPLINFGIGHIEFRQSLLVQFSSTIRTHADLDAGDTVGVIRGTTGESRFLQLVGLTDSSGYLAPNTTVITDTNETIITDQRTHKISASYSTTEIENRIHISSSDTGAPTVVYYTSEQAQIEALSNFMVDAIARGEIGNTIAASASNGSLKVTAIDTSDFEEAGFSYPNTAEGDILKNFMNAAIMCITSNGTIGFNDWYTDKSIFLNRAHECALQNQSL